MKRLISVIIALSLAVAAFSQNQAIRPRAEIATVEINEGDLVLEVFRMEDNGTYYLSLGHLGIGNDVIQVQVDPLSELFIPLGGTLAEASETLNQMKDLYKREPGETIEMQGCISVLFPSDKLETVNVTSRKFLLSRMLEFSVGREGYINATHIGKSDFNSLVTTFNLYRKVHPKQK